MAQSMVIFGILLACSPAVFAVQPNCINITLNNVLGIGDCLGGSADFCTKTSMPFTKTVTKLIDCVLKGIIAEGSPKEVANALDGIVLILLNSVGLGDVLKGVVATGMFCTSCNRVCKDPIYISTGDIGLLGKCVDDAAVLCQKGSLAEDATYTELFETLECILNALSEEDLVTILDGVVCDIVKLFKKGNVGVDILTLLIKAGVVAVGTLLC